MKQLYKMRGGVIVSIILMLAFFTVGCETDDDDDGETPSPTSYTITIAEGIEHGSVSASPTTAAAGATVTLTATPADGYELASLTVTDAGGASVTTTKDSGDTSKYTFIMPASNVTVSAVFVEESAATYTITIADSIEHGSVSAEPTTAAAGTSVTLTVTPADGYKLNTISVKDANSADVAVTQDTSDKSKYTFTMPASNVTVSATFTEATAGTGEGGSGGDSGVALSTPLTLKALTEGTIVVNSPKSGMQYSLNGGAKTAVTSEAITVAAGDTVAFYGSGTSITKYKGTKITGGTAEVKVYGNLMSLVDEEGFATATSLAEEAFYYLFRGNAKLKDAGELLLPADTLAQGCYCYMFSGCTSLTAAPALPATSLARDCYSGMFDGCTSLTAAPALPATSLAEDCYGYMFCGCSSLTAAPALPATSLAKNCYYYMFCGCSSLTEAPVLPATTLAPYCYDDMFWRCSNLKAVTCLATDISATDCTHQWLDSAGTSVTGTKTFTTPSSTNWSSGKSGIPSGWTRVDAN